MPEIAGYADLARIKGQYYRYAAAPKPVVFTGNIDEISEDTLIKAMFVSRNQASGTFPTNIGDTFLITTVKYGNNAYLQTAYLVQTGFECYEYRRIYSGEWTSWIGVDSAIKEAVDLAKDAKTAADAAASSVGTLSSTVNNVAGDVNTIKNSTLPGLNSTVNTLTGRVQTVENKVAGLGGVKLWSGTYTTGSSGITFPYGPYSMYMVLGAVRNGGSKISQMHLKAQLTTSDVKYQISDDEEYYAYGLRYSGNNAVLTYKARSATYSGGGNIQEIWGFN